MFAAPGPVILWGVERGTDVKQAAAAPPIVLASASPRRAQLLGLLGLAFSVVPADVDEAPREGEAPAALAGRLALSKAQAVAVGRPEALVIAADTVVAVDGLLLAKPVDEEQNRAFTRLLAGRQHDVFTGHALAWGGRQDTFVIRSGVSFRPLSETEIAWYAATGEGRDKAGGYALQGRGGVLVEAVHGCWSNVVGLSLPNLVLAARRLGVQLV